MFPFRVAHCIVLTCLVLFQSPSKEPVVSAKKSGMYSRNAVPVWDLIWDKGEMRIPSPNKEKVLVSTPAEDGIRMDVEAYGRKSRIEFEIGVGAEVMWSEDSRAFFLTFSEGGRNGFYRTRVYFVQPSGITVVDVSQMIEDAFGKPVPCDWDEPPNIGAVSWIEGSSRLLVAAEIVNHSVCKCRGTFNTFEVSFPDGKIEKRHAQRSSKQVWGKQLGWELVDAEDSCPSNPALISR